MERIPEGELAYIETWSKLAALDAIHREMKSRNVSKADIARRLGVDVSWVSDALGCVGELTIEKVARILWSISKAVDGYELRYPGYRAEGRCG
jgi:hypothetical protein